MILICSVFLCWQMAGIGPRLFSPQSNEDKPSKAERRRKQGSTTARCSMALRPDARWAASVAAQGQRR